MLQIIDHNIYQERIIEAQRRMNNTDIDDWPVVATALLFNWPKILWDGLKLCQFRFIRNIVNPVTRQNYAGQNNETVSA